MSDQITTIDTALGARIKVGKSPNHFGDGVALQLMMQDPEDKRWAEVVLDENAIILVIQALEKHGNIPLPS